MTSVRGLARSKVARRIVALFIVCAMLPVAGLAVVVYVQFTTVLRDGSNRRLHQASKAIGLELLNRLRGLDSELALVASLLSPSAHRASIPDALRVRLAERFSSITVIDDDGQARAIMGPLPAAPDRSVAGMDPLETGHARLAVQPRPGGTPRFVLLRRLEETRGALQAEIRAAFLWGGDLVPPVGEVHVLGTGYLPLFASETPEQPRVPAVVRAQVTSAVGGLEWVKAGESYLSAYWSVPLEVGFGSPQWTVVVSEPRSSALAPLSRAGTTFILAGLLSLWIVMLLSLSQIRRSLVPLARLQDGTRRLASGDFARDVEVRSGDEFEELADSFNTMSHRLKRQFDILSARGDLDRAVLSSLNVETIIRSLLARLPGLVDCDHVAVLLTSSDRTQTQVFWQSRTQRSTVQDVAPPFTPEDEHDLRHAAGVIQITRSTEAPGYMAWIGTMDWTVSLVVPVSIGGELVGLLALADESRRTRLSQDLEIAGQIAGQLAVALSNARLIEALDRLNVGTLSALARTVDAKSPWTAGHSQRVTQVALDIARTMELSEARLDTIARGALLHDIGKIAVPSAILNKAGPLTAEEYDTMKTHPAVGARILEPISEYQRLIPIVIQHHEWYDGRGYPHGLAGEAIALEARVVAVADVFDALTSALSGRDIARPRDRHHRRRCWNAV
jgi:putative nucleotidyltransferase with HDIG domain